MKIFAYFFSLLAISWATLVHAVDIEELKGAYLINFIKFARFEKEINNIQVCVSGEAQLFDYLEEKLPKSINESNISLKQIKDKDDIDTCNILYISRLGLQTAKETTLTITDEGGGGVVEFVELDDKLKFTVDLSRVSRAKVSFPVQVLNLAVQKKNLSFNEAAPSYRIGFNKSVNRDVTNGPFDNCITWGVLPFV